MVVNSLTHFGALQGLFRTLLGALRAFDTLFARRLPFEPSAPPMSGVVADIAMMAFGDSAGGEALSESFEKVHMIIFAVMMVFIFQTLVLMSRAWLTFFGGQFAQ